MHEFVHHTSKTEQFLMFKNNTNLQQIKQLKQMVQFLDSVWQHIIK